MLKLPAITQQIKHFKTLFDSRTYSNFQAVIKAIISLREFKQADLAHCSGKTLRQVQYFFSKAKWCAIRLNEFRLRFLRNKSDFRDRQSDFVVADSTIVSKDKDSSFSSLTDFFWSNLKKQTVNGFEIFGVSVQTNQGIKYILDFLFFFKQNWYSEASCWIQFLNKISRKTKAWIFVFDSGFRKKYLLRYVYRNLRRHFLIRIQPNMRVLFKSGFCKAREVMKRRCFAKVEQGRIWVVKKSCVKAWSDAVDFDVAIIIYQRDGFRDPLVLAVSEADIDIEKGLFFISLYFKRWGIEQLFKELKSYFAFEKFQITSLLGIRKYLMLMIFVHSLLTVKEREFSGSPPLKILVEFVLKKLRNIKELTVIGVKFFLEIAKSLTSLKWFSAYVKAKRLRLCLRFL